MNYFDEKIIRFIQNCSLNEFFDETKVKSKDDIINLKNEKRENILHVVHKITKKDISVFILTCKRGNLKMVKYIIKELDIKLTHKDRYKNSIFHFACSQNNKKDISVIQYLIEQCGKCKLSINIKDYQGYTPLHLACFNGCCPIVEYLLKNKKTNINILNIYGETPLHIACQKGHLKIMKLLLETNS